MMSPDTILSPNDAAVGKEIIDINKESIIIVEGKNDKVFIEKLISHLEYKNIQVNSIDGIDSIDKQIQSISNLPNFRQVSHLAIIGDHDQTRDQRFQQICKALSKSRLPYPESPDQIAHHNGVRVGIFLLPNNFEEGMLEDLLSGSVWNKRILECVDELWECLAKEQPDTMPTNPAKFKFRTLLSSLGKETPTLDERFPWAHFDLDHPNFNPLKEFLRKLFTP